MSQIVDDLRQVAIEIKTETQVGGNTAARVGGAFERVADALEGTQQIEDMDAAVAAVQQAAAENEQTIQDIVNNLAVVQTKGQSTSDVMSQKAVTDEIAKNPISTPLLYPYGLMTQNNGFISPSQKRWVTGNGYAHYYFARTSEMIEISVKGKASTYSYISFLKSYNYTGVPSGVPAFCDGYGAPILFRETSLPQDTIRIPDDCNYIVVNISYPNVQQLPEAVYTCKLLKYVVEYKDTTIYSHFIPTEVGYIAIDTGGNSFNSADATINNNYAFSTINGEFQQWRNVGMIEIDGGEYTISYDNGNECRIFLYDEQRVYLKYTTYSNTTSQTFDAGGAKYLRFVIFNKQNNVYVGMSKPNVTLRGHFKGGLKIAKLKKQNTQAADTIVTPVWIENTNSCNDETQQIQDNGAWHIDFGRLMLPTNYDPDGKPVRLIIYCHGGEPRYNPVYTGESFYTFGTFNTSIHINPTLFLAEGYAVMDMDGVFAIFNEKADANGIQPNSILQTAHCYQSAYDYVVRNYNIRNDGILLGGVSFGCSKALQIICNSSIPVIAAAFESPYVIEPRMWWSVYRIMLGRSVGVDGFHYNSVDVEDMELIEEKYNKMLVSSPILGACHVKSDEFFATTHIEGVGDLKFGASTENGLFQWITYVVNKWSARFAVPIKMWCCTADATALPDYNGKMLYSVGSNGGSKIELRMISGGSHLPSVGSGTGKLFIDGYVTKYGQAINNAPLVYAEAVRWWRRFEQE